MQWNTVAAKGSVINESLIYLSYHNADLAYAFQLSTLLLRYYRNVWLDRFEIDLSQDWDAEIRQARRRATGAIVVVSDDYLASRYCRAEFDALRERDIALTAVIPRDISTELIADFTFDDWIDFRSIHDPRRHSVERVLSRIPQSDAAPETGERRDYTRRFIQDIELALSKTPTAWASLRMAEAQEARGERPRMIQPDLLTRGNLAVGEDDDASPVEDLLAWSQATPQFVMLGEAGSGKTSFARLLALEQAQAALRDADAAIPVWLDLALWDDDHTSFDAFIESQWTLITFWRHWLGRQPTLLIFDNFSDLAAGCPARAAEATQWIRANPHHRIIVLARAADETAPELPKIAVGRVNAALAQHLAAGCLTLERQNSFRQLLKQKAALIESGQLDSVSIGIELLSADRGLAYNRWHEHPLSALIRLRGQQARLSQIGLDGSQIIADLRKLAWSRMLAGAGRYFARDSVLRQSIDPRAIDQALEIGILEAAGAMLAFQSAFYQWHLAAEACDIDALRDCLSPPEFAPGRGRIATIWDGVALALVDGLAEEERLAAVTQIAAIDPFLAAMCARRRPALLRDCQETLLARLLRLRVRNQAAQCAFRAAIGDMPNATMTAEFLIARLRQFRSDEQVWLWREIRALPLAPPADFIRLVADADLASPESARAQLASYPLSSSLARLAKLTAHEDDGLRHGAIRLLGEVKHLPSAMLLLDLLETGAGSDDDELVLALLKFAHSELLARVLRWGEAQPANRSGVVGALAKSKRLVTSRLLALAGARRLTLKPEFYDVAAHADETDIAIGLAQIAAGAVDLPGAVLTAIGSRADSDELRGTIAATIQHLPNRNGFEQLAHAISAVLRDPPESTIAAGSAVEALVYGEPLFADKARQPGAAERAEAVARQTEQPVEAPVKGGEPSRGGPQADSAVRTTDESAAFSDEEKISRALQVLRDDDWERTRNAARFLRRFARRLRGSENPQIVKALCDALEDAAWSVRWAAAEALATLRNQAATAALCARLDDPSWIVQVAVVRALVDLEARDLTSQLAPLLHSERKAVREATAEALGEIGDRRSIKALAATLKDDADEFVRSAALRSICQIDPEAARPHLELALSDDSAPLRIFALKQLSPRMKRSDLPVLRLLLEDRSQPAGEDQSIQELAMMTLRRLEDDGGAARESARLAEKRTSA